MKEVDLAYDRGRVDARDQSRIEIRKLEDRIEALEAALREIINVEVIDPWSAAGTMQIKARAALAPEQSE